MQIIFASKKALDIKQLPRLKVLFDRDRGATLILGGGGGTVSDSILGGGHKTLFVTNSSGFSGRSTVC